MFFALLLGGFITVQIPPAADRPPTSLTQLRDAAVAVFDDALRGNWPAASEATGTIDDALMELPSHAASPDLVHQIRGRVRALHRAVRDRQTVVAATNANWIARLSDEVSASYDTTLPGDVRLLGFFGRALEIDASPSRRTHARSDLADLRTVWHRVEPSLLQRQAVDAARQFNDALANLDAAASGGDLTRAAAAEIAVADRVAAAYAGGSAPQR
jgi:hypothetical protein